MESKGENDQTIVKPNGKRGFLPQTWQELLYHLTGSDLDALQPATALISTAGKGANQDVPPSSPALPADAFKTIKIKT